MTEYVRRTHLHRIFTRLIQAEHAKRPSRPGTLNGEPEWVILERDALLQDVNAQRGLLGKVPITTDIFIRREQTCVGHVDYASKLCIACVELVLDHA